MTGEERRSRAELEGLFRRTSELEAALAKEGKSLNANQTRLRNRILVLLGNTHFVTGSFRDALEPYNRACNLIQTTTMHSELLRSATEPSATGRRVSAAV
jgi:hypothetical protein